jgi:hypothetical protein
MRMSALTKEGTTGRPKRFIAIMSYVTSVNLQMT